MTTPKKRCIRCRRLLAAKPKNFNADSKTKDGFFPWCRPCRKEYDHERKVAKHRSEGQRQRHQRSTNGTAPATPGASSTPGAPLTIDTRPDSVSRAVIINGTLYLPITVFADALGVPEQEVVALVNA